MDATMDPVQEFIGEAAEGTDAHEVPIELVDAPDSGPLPSSDDEATTDASSGEEADGEADSVMADNLLTDEARYARWQGRRPPVSHLRPGTVFPPGHAGPLPLFDVGDRVVVEQRARLLQARPDPLDPAGAVRHPWIRTVVGKVQSIDDDTGHVVVVPEGQDARWLRAAHFDMGDPESTAFFLAPSKYGDPFDVSAVLAARREEQRKAAQAAAAAPGAPQKRGRGRPKGSLNRPKDVVQAEKEQIAKIRAEKRARRNARRGIVG